MTITLSGSDIVVTGGTSGSPITWADIVAADAAGGWGRITTLNATAPKQYLVATDTRIYIGDGGTTATYVAIEQCQIVFTTGYFLLNSGATVGNAVLRIGSTNNETYGASVSIRGLTTDPFCRIGTGTLLIYWSTLVYLSSIANSGVVITVDHSSISGSLSSYYFQNTNLAATYSILSRLLVNDASPTISITGGSLGVVDSNKDIALRDLNNFLQLVTHKSATPATWSLYDADYSSALVFSLGSGTPATINDYKTFGLTVQNSAGTKISGAAVVVKNSAGTTVYSGTTDANGQIPNQDILFRVRSVTANNTFSDDTRTPHTVTITATGYPVRTLILDMSSKHVDVEVLGGLIVIED